MGIGRWGRILSRHLERHGDLLAVCATGSRSGQDWVARNLDHIRYVTEIDDLLALPLDAVVIASPRSTHEAIAGAALAGGKHALVEKPMAATASAAARLAALAEQRRLVLAVDYTHLHDSAFEALGGRSGEFDSLALTWERPGVADPDDLLHELYPHVLSMAVSIDPGMRIVGADIAEDDSAVRVDARLAGTRTTLEAHVALGSVQRVKRLVTAPSSDGSVLVWTDRLLERHRGTTVETLHEAPHEPLEHVVRTFVEAVADRLDGQPSRVDLPSAAVQPRTQELLDELLTLARRSGTRPAHPSTGRNGPLGMER